MPYTGQSDKGLPDAVSKLPKWLRDIWVADFNDTAAKAVDDGDAMRSAWNAVRQADADKKKAEKAARGGEAARSNDMARKQAEAIVEAIAEAPETELETTAKEAIEAAVDEANIDVVGIEAEVASAADEAEVDGDEDAEVEEKSLDLMEWRRAVEAAFREAHQGGNEFYVERVSDDHIIVNVKEGTFRVAYEGTATVTTDGETEVVTGVTFAPRGEWVPVVRTYVNIKLFEKPDGRKRWLTVSSGGFVDREGEIVSSAFLEDAVARADKAADRGELWVYHVPGTRVGTCDYQAVSDGFLLESGLMDESPAAEKAIAYLQAHPDAEVSIQFAYRNRTPDGVYNPPGFIIERSILPANTAAFPWSGITLTEIPTMATLSEAKQAALEEILGADITAEVLDGLEANAAVLKEAGVRYKELSEAQAVVEAVVIETPAAESDDEQLVPPAAENLESYTETEIVFSDEAMDDIAAKLWQRVEGLVEKSVTPLGDQVGHLRTVVEAMSADMARFAESEEQRIAEKAADLPRMTVRRILRPTQRKELDESEQPGEAESLLSVGQRTLYG